MIYFAASFLEPLTVVSYGAGLVGISGFVFSFVRYNNYKGTVQLQNDNIKALQDQAVILKGELEKAEKSRIELNISIGNLQGKLESYKEIPLQEISRSLAKLATSNQDILTTLKNSAIIAKANAKHGGMLVQTEDSAPLAVKLKKG
jgi:chromosome segregation ATPase